MPKPLKFLRRFYDELIGVWESWGENLQEERVSGWSMCGWRGDAETLWRQHLLGVKCRGQANRSSSCEKLQSCPDI